MALYSRPTDYVKTFTARNCSFRLARIENTALFSSSKAKCMPVTPTPLAHLIAASVWARWPSGEVRRASDAHCPVQRFRSSGSLAGMGIQPTPSQAIGQRHNSTGTVRGPGFPGCAVTTTLVSEWPSGCSAPKRCGPDHFAPRRCQRSKEVAPNGMSCRADRPMRSHHIWRIDRFSSK